MTESGPLSPIRKLAKELNISVITTKRAYDKLEREGFIVTVAGKGSFVATINKEIFRETKLKFVEDKMTEAIETAKAVGLTLENYKKWSNFYTRGEVQWNHSRGEKSLQKLRELFFKNVNIRLDRGYIMGFIGPNGAGKSTTIKLIMNLIKKDSGTIKIFQLDHQKNELAIKDRIGFVYDENYYYEELTVEEMKNFVKPFYSRWDEAAFKNYVDQFELPLKKPIKNLSKGMKMKFSLAIALSHHAELSEVMDEPTSGLDPIIRSEFLEILQSFIQDENKSVFFSTHITSDLDKIADYITLIDDGEIILSKTKDELMEEYCLIKGTSDMVESLL